MTEMLLTYEPGVRVAAFLGVLAAMALWEVAAPRRRREIPRMLRWSNNLAVVFLDTLLVRLTFPIVAVGLAVVAQERGWGLFNAVSVPGWVAFVVSMLALDLAIYLQHVMFHAVPALWRLHRMHHADLDFDVTTGLRFHPLEILLSMAIKLAVVAALGPPAVGRADLRGAAECHRRCSTTATSGCRWLDRVLRLRRRDARHAPRPSLDPSAARRTATSASTCRGGTGCSAPTAHSPRRATRG